MVERVLCKHEVVGSIPSDSTTPRLNEAAIENQQTKFPHWLRPAAASDIVN